MKRPGLGIPLVLFLAVTARADWPTDAGEDVPVGTVGYSQTPSVIGDGKLGAFVTFEHSDSVQALTLRGEHFDGMGTRLWGIPDVDGGVIGKDLLGLTLGTGYTGKVLGLTDGQGGFIAGYAPGNSSPYVLEFQRFDKDGTAQWAATGSYGGVDLFASPYLNDAFYVIPDQQNGLLAVWLYNGAHAQRLDSTGTAVYAGSYDWVNAQYPSAFYADRYQSADGQGGLYYLASTSGSAGQSPELTHLNPSGSATFDVSVVAPQQASFSEWASTGLPDGGGAWVAWESGSALYLQLFYADGGRAFEGGDAGGLVIAQTATSEPDPTLLGDGMGGAVVAWMDVSSGISVLLAQRYGTDGMPVWGSNPVKVSSAESPPQSADGYRPLFRFIPSTDNNVAAFWAGSAGGIYGEKIAVDGGGKLWGPTSGGIEISLVSNPLWLDATFIEDDSAFVTFQDNQNRVWLKHIDEDGKLGPADAGVDAGVDAGEDAGIDAGVDAGPDAGPVIDAGIDAGVDAGIDAGVVPDAGMVIDGGVDAGTTIPDAGENTADAGVSSGGGCQSGGPDPTWLVATLALIMLGARKRVRLG